jgi:UDP-GlcNAc:undecaprenyl-phosphate/decaprenyl-phosphate GlcNAc-1-phosphate transferase
VKTVVNLTTFIPIDAIYAVAFCVAAFMGIAATLGVRRIAFARGWVTAPTLRRHTHKRAVPRLGGVAIFVASGAAAALVLALTSGRLEYQHLVSTFLAIMGPASLVFAVGLWDDFRPLRPRTKVGVQVAASILLWSAGLRITCVAVLFPHPVRAFISLPMTILWVLAITNAFNLIDGLDGLAAGSALFSTLVVFVVSIFQHNPVVSVLTAALAGSILGFLRYNFHPASIFLGDSGSLFIGFFLSAVALAGSEKASTMVAVAIPVVSFGLPILDVIIAIVRRFLSGKPLFQADAEHIHHKLLKLGFSQRHAVLVLYAVSALFGVFSLSIWYSSGRNIALVLLMIASGVFIGLQQLRYQEFGEVKRFAVRTMNQKRIITNNLNVRRAAEALAGCGSISDICSILAEHLEPVGFDGFTLQAKGLEHVSDVALTPLIRNKDGELNLSWHHGDGDYASKFSLRLVSSAGEKCGEFAVLRFVDSDPLWLDGHVFVTSSFPEALANAIVRARKVVELRPDWQQATVFSPETWQESVRLQTQGD